MIERGCPDVFNCLCHSSSSRKCSALEAEEVQVLARFVQFPARSIWKIYFSSLLSNSRPVSATSTFWRVTSAASSACCSARSDSTAEYT